MDVGAWLEGLGLGRYAAAFRANDIDREVLLALTEADLETLGVASLGHRKRLLAAIAALAAAPAEPAAPVEPDRRPVAILFCDLVGFTRLSASRDAEEVHALLQRFFAAVDGVVVAHGGTVDKHIGDCVMALFGAPRAHGDDVDRAIRAARAVQAAVADLADELGLPLEAHVGLAVGEVVAGRTGSTAHSAYTVTGDAVNLAARLADRAAPGEILAAEEVLRAARGRIDAAEVGELRLDGFDRPIRAVRIGPHATGARTAPATSFVGRGIELGQLAGLLEACRTGRRGLVRPHGGAFLFAHALIRDSVYASLLHGRRRELHRLAGDRPSAVALLRDALARCRATGMAFVGPVVLGGIVASSEDPEERHAALAEGRALLAAGSACHNLLLFRRDAIEGCLAAGELDAALAEAAALEACLGAEPVPWVEFHARRARALVALRRGGGDPGPGGELASLAALGARLGLARDARALRALARTSAAGEAAGAPAPEVP